MSYKISHEVREHSRSRHGTLHVLDSLADVAWHDGVAFTTIKPPKKNPRDKKNLAFLSRLSPRQVQRAIETLRELDELEVRVYFKGRERRYIYRVIVGAIRDVEVDYDRLQRPPTSSFWTPDELRLPRADRRPDEKLTTGQNGHSSDSGPDPEPDGEAELDEATSPPATSGHLEPGRGDISAGPTRARERERSLGTVPEERSPAADERVNVVRALPVAREKVEQDETAAAGVVGQPATPPHIVATLGRFPDADIRSLRVVEPLALQLPQTVFDEVAATALHRRRASNRTGLLVHLLEIAVDEQRVLERQHLADALAAYDQARLDRRSANPEGFLHRYLAIPGTAAPETIQLFLDRFVPDEAERARLASVETETRARLRNPAFAIEHWIRWVSGELLLEHVHAQIDEFVDEWGIFDHVERGGFHELAEDVRQATLTAVDVDEAVA